MRRYLALLGIAGVVTLSAAGCGGRSPFAPSASPNPATATTAPSSSTTPSPSPVPPTTPAPPSSVGPPATVPDSAQAGVLLSRASHDAVARGWAHVISTDLQTVAGPNRGTQTVTSGSLTGLIRVLPAATYIRGSAAGLVHLFGVPAAAAAKVAEKWVILTRADREFRSVTVNVTLPSVIQQLDLQAPLRSQPYDQNGTRGTVISGSLPAGAGIPGGLGALLVTSGAQPLPDKFAGYTRSGQIRIEESFTRWGVAEPVTAPAGAVLLPAAAGTKAAS